MKKLLAPLLIVLLVTTAASCGGGDDGGGASSGADAGAVAVKDNKFEPKELTVAVGDTVTWKFEGAAAHNVTGPDFKSDLMSKGEYEWTFDEAGEYEYVCTVHPGMKGTVVVE